MNREKIAERLGWGECQTLDKLEAIVRDAVSEEREACAKMVEELHYCACCHDAPEVTGLVAEVIRARGEKPK